MTGHRDQDKNYGAGGLMDMHALAAYLDCSPSWVKQNPDLIPYVRLGNKLKRWRKEDVDRYLASKLRGAAE